MEALAIQNKPAYQPSSLPIATPERQISWEEFQRKFLSKEDEYKYEWVDGTVEKTKRNMDQSQYQILRNLRRLFETLKNEQKIKGGFEPEVDTFFMPKVHRRPDMVYFSEEQEDLIAFGDKQVPLFVIEVISTNDAAVRLNKKMKNYRDAGVQVVWQIYPESQEVYVCSGNKLQDIKVCLGEDLCSAAPVLTDFSLPAKAVFALPQRK